LEAILGGSIPWKKLQTGAIKLLGWPIKGPDGKKDRFPNRFYDLKISEMKSIINVIDGIAVIDSHEGEGKNIISVVQQHIDRIISTYQDVLRTETEWRQKSPNFLGQIQATSPYSGHNCCLRSVSVRSF